MQRLFYFPPGKIGVPEWKMPDGNEAGMIAGQWVPGGKTMNGTYEATLVGSENIIHNLDIEELLNNFSDGDWEKLQ